ncbi:MAG TPA: nucleoside triphosphate pyrophosphohydrolase family protein [Candidatus Saccharimonadales bacterium]|nr:nucleoside triphosphate pyrophosphohydrolase family protein [Candidatus Saccharimonadales bacterium]
MTFDEYQTHALKTVLSTDDDLQDLMHWVLGINGEAGEIAEKLKKIIRDKQGELSPEDVTELGKEIGDVLWYLAVFANHLGLSFDDLAAANIQKLADRQKRNVLNGSGDNR